MRRRRKGRRKRALQRVHSQLQGPGRPANRAAFSVKLFDLFAPRWTRLRGATTNLASAAANGRITPAALMLLSPHRHAAAAPAHIQREQKWASGTDALRREGSQNGCSKLKQRALGGRYCTQSRVPVASSTACGHWRSALLTLPGLRASLRRDERGRPVPLPVWRAPLPTAGSCQPRWCLSAIGATPPPRLRTRSRMMSVSDTLTPQRRCRNGCSKLKQLASSASVIAGSADLQSRTLECALSRVRTASAMARGHRRSAPLTRWRVLARVSQPMG